MIDHIGICVKDYDASKAFYDAALGAIGATMVMTVPEELTNGVKMGGYGHEKPDFWLTGAGDPGPGRHIPFSARSRAEVDAFYKAAMEAGGRDNGKPGIREHYHPHYYGAFVFDPDGNNVEAVCHKPDHERE